MQSLFEFLFKYRPALFEQGELALAATPLRWVVACMVGLALVALALRFRPRGEELRRADRILLLSLRLAVVALLVFCLLQPSLVLTTVVPQESFVGVLFDDSRSMRIRDGGELSRGEWVAAAMAPESSFWQSVQERFQVRSYGFADDARRLEGVVDLAFDGGETSIATALARAEEELGATPLSGLVLVSDGAESGSSELTDVLLSLRASGIPVHVVGVGSARFDRDVEVSRVVAPRRALVGSSLTVEVTLDQRGYSGRSVRLEVEDEGRIVNVQDVEFPADGETATARVDFTVTEPGNRLFRFRVAADEDEQVEQNNERFALIEVVDRKEKILYFEGEPRFEVKFLRRAVADDANLQVVLLQRTAENKFLRLDVDDPLELQGGFPTSREELFQYRGLILGSVEASFFTYEQMRMIVDFVSQRGGGLLVLGGRRALAEGGYAGTPLAEVLPVRLREAGGAAEDPFFARLDVTLSPQGRSHPALRLADEPEASAERWQALPPLSTFNRVVDLAPGATALLLGRAEGLDGEQVVLAHQRYGRGRVLALTVHDTWMWQMHQEIPLEDMTHETLWRQLLRWLVSYVPDPVEASTSRDRVAPDEPIELRAEVRDAGFLALNRAAVTAAVRSPSGETEDVALEWSVREDGEFVAEFLPSERGVHRVEIDARSEGELLGAAETSFEVGDLDDEFFGAERDAALLSRVAEETGGAVYELDRLDDLAEDLGFSGEGATVREYRDLWDMPAIFLLLLGLLAAEWIYRRRRGLA